MKNMKLKNKAQKLKIELPAIIIALKQKDTPIFAKLLAGITIVYALSPIDLIPDFIPILGYLDDLIILPFLIKITVKLIPKEVMDRCRIKSENYQNELKQKKWYYAIPFIIIWILIIIIIIKAIF